MVAGAGGMMPRVKPGANEGADMSKERIYQELMQEIWRREGDESSRR